MELDWLNSWLATMPAMSLVLARIGALFATAPVLGAAYVPTSVKSLLAVAIALVLTPKATPQVIALDFSYLLLVIRETVFGMSLGWLLSLYMEGVRMGGELINRHAGFSAAENFDPESNIGAGPMGDLLHFGAILLFLATDGHLLFLASLARSFEILPLGSWTPPANLGELLARGVSDSWSVALALSFPVLSAVMVLTLVEGVMSRAIPQINVMSVSFAVKILVSVGVMYSGLPAIVAFLGTVLVAMHGLGNAFIAAH